MDTFYKHLPFPISFQNGIFQEKFPSDCEVLLLCVDKDIPFNGMHKNNFCQWVFVLEGSATLFLDQDDNAITVQAGMTLFIDKYQAHGIKINAGYKDITIRGNYDE